MKTMIGQPCLRYPSSRLLGKFAWALFLLLFSTPLRAQSSGTLIGRVSNKATSLTLDGARIEISPGSRTVYTAEGGIFRVDLAPGEYTLAVTYSGLDRATSVVSVSAEKTSRLEFDLTTEIYQLSKFVVEGEREGQALAVTQQRNAPNVMNVISADAFGSIAKANIGNMLQRVPGVIGVQGEVDISGVSIRGIEPNLSEVTMDGDLAAGAQTGGGNRRVRIDALQAQFIKTVEVVKAPTPDMSAASAGGRVNLITKSAFDTKGTNGGYSVGFIYDVTFGEGPNPSTNVYYSSVFGEKQNIGLYLTANWDEVTTTRSSTVKEVMPSWDFASPYWHYFERSAYDIHNQVRSGFSAKVDYKLGQTGLLQGTVSFTRYADNMFRNRNVFPSVQARVVAQRDAAGVGRNAANQEAHILPGFDEFITQMERQRYQTARETRDKITETLKLRLNGRHQLGAAKLDYDMNYSTSDGTEFRETLTGTSNNRFNYTHDRRQSTSWPTITVTSGVDPLNETFANAGLTIGEIDHEAANNVWGGNINLRREFKTAWPIYLKTGASLRVQEVNRDDNSRTWVYASPNASAFLDRGWTKSAAGGKYPLWPHLSIDSAFDSLHANPAQWTPNADAAFVASVSNDVTLQEAISAAYLMGNIDFQHVSMLAGLRYERADVEGTAPRVNTRAPVATRYAERVSGKGSNDHFFPGVHLKSEFFRGLMIRGSVTTSIGRPQFANILPRLSIDELNRTISQNNPALLPQDVTNFDLSIEKYFEPAGLISAGLFRKNIKDYIVPTVERVGGGADNGFAGDYEGYSLQSSANGGTGKVQGIELSYSQQFSFLPGYWKGLGMFVNYTYLQTEGNFGGAVEQKGEIPGFAPRTGNLGVSYSLSRWSVRAQVNYVGTTLTGASTDLSYRPYNYSRYVLDINTRFKINNLFMLYCDLANVTEAHKMSYAAGLPSRELQVQMQGMTVSAGITGRF